MRPVTKEDKQEKGEVGGNDGVSSGFPTSPFVPGDLVIDEKTGGRGTIVRIPHPSYSDVHINGKRELIPNGRLSKCNSPEDEHNRQLWKNYEGR